MVSPKIIHSSGKIKLGQHPPDEIAPAGKQKPFTPWKYFPIYFNESSEKSIYPSRS
jgi:hypothetical protein